MVWRAPPLSQLKKLKIRRIIIIIIYLFIIVIIYCVTVIEKNYFAQPKLPVFFFSFFSPFLWSSTKAFCRNIGSLLFIFHFYVLIVISSTVICTPHYHPFYPFVKLNHTLGFLHTKHWRVIERGMESTGFYNKRVFIHCNPNFIFDVHAL